MSNPFDPFLGAPGVTLMATPVYVGPATSTTPSTTTTVNGSPVVTPGVAVLRQVAPFPALFDPAWVNPLPYVGGFM